MMRLRDVIARLLAEGHAQDHPDIGVGAPDDGNDGVPLRPSAVLVAITDRPEPGLILTQRASHLRKHAGQVAFPGGGIDPDDADAVAAALREAEEEIGLPPALVDVIGTGDVFRTWSGFSITPVIGVIPADVALTPQPDEVEAVFEVPLAHILDPAVQVIRQVVREGTVHRYLEILWQDRLIWGVTGAMLLNLNYRLNRTALAEWTRARA